MKRSTGFGGAVVVLASMLGASAQAQDAGTTSLSATDFVLTLSRLDASGNPTVLTAAAIATYFSIARCACPTNVVADLTLDSAAAANLGTQTVDAQLVIGEDCDIATATTPCTSVGGALTLSPTETSTTQSLGTAAIFAAGGDAGCGAATTSTRLWAIVRLDGERLATEPSLALTLGGAGPTAPTAVKAQVADQGLLVSWTATGDATTLQGHQVLCSPGAATASTAVYDTCPASLPDGGTGPFATLEPQFVCSDLVLAGTSSVRVHGLDNGRTYDIAVVAVGLDGTPSAPSAAVQGTPGPTYGLADLYRQDGGAAQGCSVVGVAATTKWGAVVALAIGLVVALARRRRARSGSFFVALVVAGFVARPALAQMGADGPSLLASTDATPSVASPHGWNLELRFGPYRPDVDSEFAARGSAARPFAQLFGSSQHLMMQLEVDRQLLHRGGTWALGVSVGYTNASAPALASDMTTPSGDETGLRLIPLSAALVYRADVLRQRYGSLLVPYAKAGLDCTLWRMSDTAEPNLDGRTFGWHAAAGVSLDVSFLDPEAARTMDRESGVNQTAIFFEVAHYGLDNFGSGAALHLGDTTWFAGLMLEL
jgi:hypothetical protein